MLYNHLADSFDDLAPLTDLIGKLENCVHNMNGIVREQYLGYLFERIRSGITQRMRIFCAHSDIYIKHLMIKANHTLIYLHEVIRNLDNRIYLSSREICLFTNFSVIAEMLRELVIFFETLAISQH